MTLLPNTTLRNLLITLSFPLAVVALLQGCSQAKNGAGTSPAPTAASSITSVTPNSGAVGTSVMIDGTNLGAAQVTSTVTFNGTAATPTSWSGTSIAVAVPSGATTGNVVVTVNGVASNGVSFTVTAAAPSITSLSQTSGPVGTAVTITGTNFGTTQGTSTVTFNGTAATPTSWSGTSIAVAVPSGATTGNVVVTVNGVASNGVSFTVTTSGSITVTISPVRAGLTITQPLSVTATTNDSAGVNWSATSGSFSASSSLTGVPVTYTAPSTAGTYTITATSVTDITVSASLTVGVTNLAGMYTYHNDLARDGSNLQEYALTTSNVSTTSFGKLFSCTVDGAVYAQPLWVANLAVGGVKHNVVFVATQHDSLFAFDADANPCVQLWTISLIDTNHGGTSGETTVPSGVPGYLVGQGDGDITPEVGVTGTPVIDPSTGTLYVVSKSVNSSGPTFYQRLHAIDITTGNEKFGGPANIASSNVTYPGTGDGDGASTDSFNPQQENQRPGLALVNGIVYVAWASHEDTPPYYGWIVGFNASNLTVASIFNDTPNARSGGIWMGGGAPSADASGNVYVITGNGEFDANTGGSDYGDSFLQLSGALNVSSYFAPSDQANDDANDQDFGAGGSAVVLNLTSGPLKHLVIGGGKDGSLYLLNGDNMGVFGDSNARQLFNIGNGIFATGAFWNNNFYIAGWRGPLVSYSFNSSTNLFNTSVSSQSSTSYGFPGASPSASSNGTSNGIVWALDNTNYCTAQSPGCGPAVLHAYNASSLTSDLWNSSLASADAAGNAVKFTVPTVANGKVYVGTRGNNTGGVYRSTSVSGELDVYGLKPN
jgi:IPT/TIG domain